MILCLIGLMFLFMLLGFPMLMGMSMSPLITMLFFAPQVDLTILVQRMVAGVSTYVLLAVPMFILAADIMAHGEMADRLLGFVGSWVRHIPGGLAITAGGAYTIFGAISGSTQATLVAMGRPMFKPMLKAGYPISHVIALLMCNANIALLIPPSVCMIMYCVCTGESVGELFMAGIAPGIFMFLCFAANSKFWNTLPDDVKAIVEQSTTEAYELYKAKRAEENVRWIAELGEQMEVIEFTDEMRAPFQEIAEQNRGIYTKLAGDSGQAMLELFQADIDNLD